MSEFEKDDEMEDLEVVVMTDEEGNEHHYYEDMIVPLGDKKFAVLVSLEDVEGCDCDEEDCDCEGPEVFIARIEIDEAGDEIYVDPTDEEFEAVLKICEEMEDEEDEE